MLFIPMVSYSGGRPGDFVCVRCGTPLASERDLAGVMGRPERATYSNPLGVECEIVTLRSARNLVLSDFSSTEHTWFEGYAWRPAGCPRCGTHVGWRYEASDPALDPQSFYGLLLSAVKMVDE